MVWELLQVESNEDDLWDFMEVWAPDRDQANAGIGHANLDGVKQICAVIGDILRQKEELDSKKSSYRKSFRQTEEERPEEPLRESPRLAEKPSIVMQGRTKYDVVKQVQKQNYQGHTFLKMLNKQKNKLGCAGIPGQKTSSSRKRMTSREIKEAFDNKLSQSVRHEERKELAIDEEGVLDRTIIVSAEHHIGYSRGLSKQRTNSHGSLPNHIHNMKSPRAPCLTEAPKTGADPQVKPQKKDELEETKQPL